MITVSGERLYLGYQILQLLSTLANLVIIFAVLEGMIPYTIDDEQKVNLLTIRVQNNKLTVPVAPAICNLNVDLGDYELVELGVDCEICPDDCALCKGRCY